VRARALAISLVLGAAACTSKPKGPIPEGTRVLDGAALDWDVSANGEAAIGEIRGHHKVPGDTREHLVVAVAPDWKGENLGPGATLGALSPDARWMAWLASRDRDKRLGPGSARAVAGGGAASLGPAMPPFVFGGDGRVRFLAAFDPAVGRGLLYEASLAGGPARMLTDQVPPDGFATLGSAQTIVIRSAAPSVPCTAMLLTAGKLRAISQGLDCASASPPFFIDDPGTVWLRHFPDGAGHRALGRWRDPSETVVTPSADVFAIDGAGGAWWAASTSAGTISVSRLAPHAPAPEDVARLPGRFPRSIHPVPGGGAWLVLADRACAGDGSSASAIPACLRIEPVGGAAAPPRMGMIQRIESSPRGWPIGVFAGDGTPPALTAFGRADAGVPIGAAGRGIAFSPDGRFAAARILLEDGESVVLADLETGALRTLSRGAPDTDVRWADGAVFHLWRAVHDLDDPRNGVYRVAEVP
jgi:hypothetical protein